jgi:DNA-binding transcriptional ArsR family regulator
LSRGLVALESSRARAFGALGVALLASGVGALFGLSAALLTLAAGTLLGGILLFWSSLQGLAGETPLTLDEALSLGAPSAEEEQKQAVLRALKDLEYERNVGKISEDDYRELSQHYRSEAKALLLLVDRDLAPSLSKAEALLADRLGRPATTSSPAAPPSTEAAPASDTANTTECSQCQTQNDRDARFCKKCGQALAEGGA